VPHFQLLELLAIGFLAALILGLITHRLRLSPIVGYLLAGFLIGPNTPGFIADAELTGQLAEVGVILLMFGVGLHFDLKDLLTVKWIAIPGAVVQSLVATALGVIVAMIAGLSLSSGLILGLGLAVASTVVLMRVLMDNEMLDTIHGHVAVGWLIVEDIFTVLVLVVLPAIAILLGPGGGGGVNVPASLGLALLKLAVLWVLILPVGGRVIPWLMSHVARTRSRELFVLTILVLAFVIATSSAMIFGASVALGAFLAGMVVGKTNVSHQAASDVLPMRDAFAVLFFISVGMLFDPGFVVQQPVLVMSCLIIILLAKPLIAFLVVAVLGYSVRTALTVALSLSQIGEFSFILAQQAVNLNLMPGEGYSVLVACALISISINPLLFKSLNPIENWLRDRQRLWRFLNHRVERKGLAANIQTQRYLSQRDDKSLAIVVGYGPVGRRVASLLREFDIQPVIVDLNVDTIQNLVAQGQSAVYGDGSRSSILIEAGIEQAEYLLITLPDLSGAIATITTARDLNAGINILVRTRYLGSKTLLEGLGVKAISFEEEEVAKAMAALLFQTVKNQ
jgi:CPA2 family monovalent cation:H+ antiporter-2